MPSLQYVKHESISLRSHSDFSETWLHDRIADDPSILGLGELDVIKKEITLSGGGRLDMLLADPQNGTRYEVEIMLGATDPSHIVRTIEYWDLERRRYPAYDHVAVLVAEQVTSRFLNVMSLLAGSIPLVAIQLNALKVANQIILDFVKVLDQRQLREDLTVDIEGADVDRSTWENRVGTPNMQICDRIAGIANEVAEPKLELRYKKTRVALSAVGSFFNHIVFWPKKSYVPMRLRVSNSAEWIPRLKEAGVDAAVVPNGTMDVDLQLQVLNGAENVMRELIHQVVKEQHE